jgi:hypothetical protein
VSGARVLSRQGTHHPLNYQGMVPLRRHPPEEPPDLTTGVQAQTFLAGGGTDLGDHPEQLLQRRDVAPNPDPPRRSA